MSLINIVSNASRLCKTKTFIFGSRVRTFTSNIRWETNLRDGLKRIKGESKPGMIVFYKIMCEACRKLKANIENSKEVAEKSQKFVCIGIVEEDDPQTREFAPDGGYFPRILFVDTKGKLMYNIYGTEQNAELKYYYYDSTKLLKSMEKVLALNKM